MRLKAVKNVKSINIKEGINLHYIYDDKFKTTTLGVYIHTPLSKQYASYNALIPMVLKRGSKNCPSFLEIEKKLGDLCGAEMNSGVIKRGEDQIICFTISTVSDKYYIGNENILDECSDLLFDIILNPVEEDGDFLKEYTESEKRNLSEMIDGLVNDKQTYALWRLYEVMCRDEAYGVHEYGTKSDADKIDPKSLYEHYKQIIKESRIDIFVCGSADVTHFAVKARAAFAAIDRKEAAYPTTEKIYSVGEIKKVVEEFDTNQAKLSLGLRVGENVDYAGMLVTNSVWGSGAHSKLFNNVREKLSLAYYAFSRYERYKNCILVGMGIETKNYKEALDETLLQLDNICKGDFSETEITASKAFLINLIQSKKDSQHSMIEYYLSALVCGFKYDMDEICEQIKKVKRDEIVTIAKTIKLDSIYFLKGRE